MAFKISIDGPDYELMHSSFEYHLTINSIPDELVDKDYSVSIIWYKDDKAIALYQNEYVLKLYDAEGPASGSYSAKCTLSYEDQTYEATSNSLALEMGSSTRILTATIQGLQENMTCKVGERISFTPIVICNYPNPTISTKWYKDHVLISEEDSLILDNVSVLDEGEYTFHTYVTKKGAYKSFNQNFKVELSILQNITCKPVYIHDLRPARDKGFIQVGWWVIDEIAEANKDGFDWVENPYDVRFKYSCELANIINGFSKWDDLEIQESRNGYIIGRQDLVKTRGSINPVALHS